MEANKAQYNLDRETAKISVLLSSVLDKNECLTGQDLAPKPGVIEQNQFLYSQLGQIFSNKL